MVFSYWCVLHGIANNDLHVLGRNEGVRKVFLAFCNFYKFEFLDLQSISTKIILFRETATCN